MPASRSVGDATGSSARTTKSASIPGARGGSYFPDWLLERRRRAEQALITVVATSYLLGVSTRRVERLVEALDIARLSKSQVSEMAKSLDAQGRHSGLGRSMPGRTRSSGSTR